MLILYLSSFLVMIAVCLSGLSESSGLSSSFRMFHSPTINFRRESRLRSADLGDLGDAQAGISVHISEIHSLLARGFIESAGFC